MKTIRINLNNYNTSCNEPNFDSCISYEKFEQNEYGFLGGRGLTDKTLSLECDPTCNALSPQNVLVFATSLFAGTILPSCNRLSIGAKSPLTGTIKESNAGGTFAKNMASLGIKRIIFTGSLLKIGFFILHICKDGKTELINANEYQGDNTYSFCEKMRTRFGDKISVACIGSAGENLHLASSIQVTEFQTGLPCRAAARGGLGAVMGSKGIKALVIDTAITRAPSIVPGAYTEKFKMLNKIVCDAILNNPLTGTTMHDYGSAAGIDVTGKMGALPTNNFSGKKSLLWDALSSKNWRNSLLCNGGKSCIPCQPGCIVRCSNSVHAKSGKFVSAGMEYETLGLCGANLGIYDIDVIASIDRFCDDFGLDTIEIGAALGVIMDNGYLPFGDAKKLQQFLETMWTKDSSKLQKLLPDGCAVVGAFLGAKRIPIAKNQAMAAYDPRVIKGYGMTFEKSPMGADHTSGSAMTFRKDLSPEAQTDTALSHICTCDCFMCLFPWAAVDYNPAAREAICKMAGIITGIEQTDASLIDKLGSEILNIERDFNKKAGFTQKDDVLADFFYKESAEATQSPYISPFITL